MPSRLRVDERIIARAAAIAYVAFLLFVVIGINIPALQGTHAEDGETGGSALVQIGFVGLLLVAGALAMVAPRKPRGATLGWTMLAATAWMTASVAWAQFPDLAVRRILLVDIHIATCLLLVNVLGARRAVDLLAATLAGVMIADLVAIALLPGAFDPGVSLSPVGAGSGWRGLHAEKNLAGSVAAVAVLAAMYKVSLAGIRVTERIVWGGLMLAALVFLLGTGSKTSLGFVPLAVAGGLAMLVLSRMRWLALTGAVILCAGAAIVWFADPALQDVVNDRIATTLRDPNAFTGRTQLWRMVVHYVPYHPWLGFGYGSFWLVGSAGPVDAYVSGLNRWMILMPYAHNGYLDLLVQVGWIGLVLGVVAAVLAPLAKLIGYRHIPPAMRWWIGALITFFALHNLLESTIFGRPGALWVCALTAIFALSTYRGSWRADAVRPTGRSRVMAPAYAPARDDAAG